MLIYVFWYFFEKDTYYLKLYKIIFFFLVYQEGPVKNLGQEQRDRGTRNLSAKIPCTFSQGQKLYNKHMEKL